MENGNGAVGPHHAELDVIRRATGEEVGKSGCHTRAVFRQEECLRVLQGDWTRFSLQPVDAVGLFGPPDGTGRNVDLPVAHMGGLLCPQEPCLALP
jgi:hypothetical protein